MTLQGVMTLEAGPAPVAASQFGAFPVVTTTLETQATATVEERDGFFQLNFVHFTAATFHEPAIPLEVTLNPQVLSTGTVSQLDDNGEPFQNHQLIFHLTIQIGGQQVNFENVRLSGSSNNLGLDGEVEAMGFQTSDDQPATLKITSMKKDLGGDVIDPTVAIACGDCPCDFASVPQTDDCWTGTGTLPDPPSFLPTTSTVPTCTLEPCAAPSPVLFLVATDTMTCVLNINDTVCGTVTDPATPDPTLTADQVTACECQLEAYATALDNNLSFLRTAGFGVLGGPPFDCTSTSN